MYLLIAVINNEEILDELMTGWLDIGITEATVVETTDLVQLISTHIPIFAGFRSLTTGGMPHNRTVFTAVEKQEVLDQAVRFLEVLCEKTEKPRQGTYFVVPLLHYGRLGRSGP
ncbi:MAG: hypothetical protein DRG82_00330 [Deltaproteobacteria bacterium]|nr:MAG: hypothetical protein B1H13_10735 [Desulfobacteraceae bacterium 4484_190.3]RLB19734.1 MAG: hypothetical protein DRG82_00330 [Deltaproteobacteria bacterium]